MTRESFTVVICGAGIGGLTLAAACAQAGFSVDVVERTRELAEAGAGIQLGPNAMQVLAELNLVDSIEEVSVTPHRAVLRRYADGKALLTTHLNPAHEQRYGQKYFHLHRADLHAILLRKAQECGARIHFELKARSFERHEGRVVLDCGTKQFSGDVLVGADGIHSAVRDGLCGDAPARFTGQTAWRGLVATDDLPEQLISRDANVWLGPGKHFVAYYVRGGSLINFVAVREQTQWTEESWQAVGKIDDVQEAFAGWDPRIGQLLDACTRCYHWGLFDRPVLNRWQQDGVVLVGDACHPMLPFMAQGAAMAIEDAWVLTILLSNSQETIESSLIRYEALRKPRTSTVHAISSRNARTYHRSGAVGVALRNLSFGLATAIPSITQFMLDKIYGLDVTQPEYYEV